MKYLLGGHIACLDPQKVFERPRDIVTFDHFGGAGHGAFEPFLCCFGMFGQAHCGIDNKGPSGLYGVKDGPVAANDPPLFKVLHPAQASEGGQAHPVGEVEVADPPIAAEFVQYSVGDCVKVGYRLQE